MNVIVFDTEATDTVKHNDNNAHPETSCVYDMGWVIMDNKTFEIKARRSYVISDVFYGMADAMKSAYYADKLPQYHEGIKSGEWIVKSFMDVWRKFAEDCKEFKVKQVWAFNALYDLKALNSTMHRLSNGFRNYFFPYGITIMDVWACSANTITCRKKYVQWTFDNGYYNKISNNPKTSAEVIYRYLTDDNDFIERHTACADAEIEAFILRRVLKAKKKKTDKLGNGWRMASDTAIQMGFKKAPKRKKK